MLLVRLL